MSPLRPNVSLWDTLYIIKNMRYFQTLNTLFLPSTMTPTEAINTLYYDDMDILHINNWRFFTPKKRDRDDTPQRQKQYHTYYAPMIIERWALPLFKSAGLVPKSSKTIARSLIKCASCEICSYHLGLESPVLSPPFKDMYICDVCSRTYHHWQCLLKTSCCNATEGEAIDANDSWACPACINLNQNEKRLWKCHGTQPGSQKKYKTRVRASNRASKSLKSILLHQTYLSLHQMNT